MDLLAYTTVEAIGRRLAGRLQIGSGNPAYGKTSIDEHTIEHIGLQVEAKVDAMLRQVYAYPLALGASLPIVASVVEKGVICEIADIHLFQGEEGNSFGREMCRQYAAELAALVDRKFLLAGEKPLAEVDLSMPSYAASKIRTPGEAELIKW